LLVSLGASSPAFRTKLLDQIEHLAGLSQAECSGRFVENDEVAGKDRCPGDSNGLALPTRHEGNGGIEFRQLHLQPLDDGGSFSIHSVAVEKPEGLRKPGRKIQFAAAIEVLRRRQIVEKRQILIDGFDPGPAGGSW
jgi:hypothetical protein